MKKKKYQLQWTPDFVDRAGNRPKSYTAKEEQELKDLAEEHQGDFEYAITRLEQMIEHLKELRQHRFSGVREGAECLLPEAEDLLGFILQGRAYVAGLTIFIEDYTMLEMFRRYKFKELSPVQRMAAVKRSRSKRMREFVEQLRQKGATTYEEFVSQWAALPDSEKQGLSKPGRSQWYDLRKKNSR